MGAKVMALLPALTIALVALAERFWPRRPLQFGRGRRWITSFILFASNRTTVWLMAWFIAIPSVALWAQSERFGLFNQISLPLWAEILATFLLFDFALWLQHLLTHKIPLLWRFHKVHHADPDIDVSTAIRFHPGEIAFSVLWKCGWVVMLGASAPIVLAFEAWLTANAAFNHGNLALPYWLDRPLRWLLVTPDMHLVHHSALRDEQQRNYGIALTWWDRLFGSYQNESVRGREKQTIGLTELQSATPTRIVASLKLPLT